MSNATFLLAINFSIGLSFAAAFLALTWRSGVALGRWCAAGFLAAAASVSIEALAFAIPSVRLTSALSFSLLMLALTLVAMGILRHYRPRSSLLLLALIFAVACVLNPLVVFDQPRGTWAQAIGYQGPYVLMLAIAAGSVLAASRRRAADLALAAVLALCALQFAIKTVVGGLAGTGPGVRDYITSAYAHYSQTMGGILSILLGLALVGVVVTDVIAETARRLQRDPLSGTLNRAAFLDEASRALERTAASTPSSLIMCDLDHFKSINDRFGHAAGDEAIRAFGATLTELTGENGLCGRVGGEEFCILLTDCSIAGARVTVDAIRQRFGVASYARIPADLSVTASFGIAITDRDEPLESAMHRADLALYEAKAAGRDGYRFAPLATDAGDAPSPRSASLQEG